MSLVDKIVKHKRLQRLSGSLAMIIPESWIRNMEWKRDTPFAMEFKPFTKQIIITEEFEETLKVKIPQFPVIASSEPEPLTRASDPVLVNPLLEEDEFHGKDPGDPMDNPNHGKEAGELVTV